MTLGAAPSDDSADRQRFRALWADHYADVLAFVRRRVSDREVAADVVAETYLVAWRRRNELPEDARPWLFGAARKLIGNSRRGEHRRAALVARLSRERTAEQAVVEMGVDNAIRADVAAAFNRLSGTDREILALIAWEGLTPSEAARVLGMPTARFSVRLHRARRRLRNHLPADAGAADSPARSSSAPHPVSEIQP